jgi:hypothetical protein
MAVAYFKYYIEVRLKGYEIFSMTAGVTRLIEMPPEYEERLVCTE